MIFIFYMPLLKNKFNYSKKIQIKIHDLYEVHPVDVTSYKPWFSVTKKMKQYCFIFL